MKNRFSLKKVNLWRVFFITIICVISLSVVLSLYNFLFYANHEDKNTIQNPEKVVLVDVTGIEDPGGVYILSKYLVQKIAEKRPNWKLLVFHTDETNHLWDSLTKNNVVSFHAIKNYPVIGFLHSTLDIFELLPNFVQNFSKSVQHFLGKLKFFFLYSRWIPNIDLIFDPVTTYGINNFYYPRVTIIHDMLYYDIPTHLFQYKISSSATKFAAKYSDQIITISRFTKRRIIDVFDIDESKIHLIYTQLSKRLDDFDAKNASEILKKYALTSNNYIVYPSAFWRHKNHSRLIAAFIKYKQTYKTSLKLVMIGHAPQKSNIDIRCPPEFCEDVIITGFISDTEFMTIMKNAKAVIQCSLYEGFGMTVLEGMAAGKPVIASNIASIPEVAEDAVLYFDPYDIDDICRAIRTITNSPLLRNTLIEKGRKQVEKFSNTDQMIDEYIKVLESVMNRK